MKILVVAPKNKTVVNFRGDLIKDMLARNNEVYVTGPNREFIDDIIGLGITEFIEVPLVKDNTSVRGDLAYLKKLKRVMTDIKPDLVFSYTIKPVIYGSIAAESAAVPRIFAMVTGLGRVYASDGLKASLVRLLTRILYKTAFKSCNKVIFQNDDDVRKLVAMNCVPEKKTVVVNGSGVNMERFCKTEIPERPSFLMVSRIIREKGVIEYCEAARELRKACPEARCILLGGFDTSIGALQISDIQPFIDDGSIELPGEVKDPVSFYDACSVFVLPSYYREGLPRTILEAMACGRPVITTDWPGCREPVEEGVTGFLVPVRDSKALAARMIELARDVDKARTMGNAAFVLCREKYEVGIINAQMRKIMEY